VSFSLEDFQTGARGSAQFRYESGCKSLGTIFFQFAKDAAKGKAQTRTEALKKDVLIGDMVGPFLVSHWNELASGKEVKCRYIALDRRETVGFTFVKEREGKLEGRPVIIVKMEATSPIIAELIDPLFFTIEKEGKHHVLEYAGRTTPKVQVGAKWKELDAVTVFDWK
jgi:hypothetical protein